ncbi:acyltransferase domain-containing protein [Actinomadura sp. DC4]|uniref:acyltransferase domain-containing protein n=1 Tax=Actinomadura sp. DC4 TaxID=3055069 RepID=UPI0025B17A7D|nr:acyltransferase domain-containing protein [Actinomadura sp. DC4]MDN3352031.1 acyltransferase domain-containing protein [Actinomadura sp. DC4]
MDSAQRLGLSPEWSHRLDGVAPVKPRLPAPGVLDRLAVAPDDAAEIRAGWPSDEWPEELSWLLGRVVALVGANLGGAGWLVPGPWLPRGLGPDWKHFYVYVYLALLEDALAYHARRGISEEVSWATLADLGRNLAIDRRMNGEGWSVMLQWLTLHVRGGLYELGRLQYQRAREGRLALHIPRSGPLTPQACDASLELARPFFKRHFPNESYESASCGSWLLDPMLAEYLPPGSNLLRFQRRFELQPGGEDAVDDIMHFVFGTHTTPLDGLRAETSLQRAVLAHLRAGGRWQRRTGVLAL